jgi:hypothetical protein
MAARSVLLAACVVARDPRVDARSLLDLWSREGSVPVVPLEREGIDAAAAVLDDLDRQSFLLAVARGTRTGLTVGCHLGTRVNGRHEAEPAVSERSLAAARQLALAAGDGQVILSGDLGAFMTISRARLAPNLESVRLRVGKGPDAAAYRLRVAGPPPATARAANGSISPATLDEGRRSQLLERLGAALTPCLGPIAPLMLQQLPPGRMSSEQLLDAILRDVPPPQRDAVRRLIEDEIRRLRQL